jgi:hypothetical protein
MTKQITFYTTAECDIPTDRLLLLQFEDAFFYIAKMDEHRRFLHSPHEVLDYRYAEVTLWADLEELRLAAPRWEPQFGRILDAD